VESRSGLPQGSKPTVRKAQPLSGERKAQEANATRRKAGGIHNPVDRGDCPSSKDG